MRRINSQNIEELASLLNYSQFEYENINESVKSILKDVKLNKDEACFSYTQKFDKILLTSFKVTNQEINEAYENIDPILIKDLEDAYNNIKKYHELQLPKDYFIEEDESIVGQLIRPIEKVGMYVPGGTAAYPSTVLMNAAPAKITGVKKLVMVTPPNAEGKIKDVLLVAAKIAGVDEIYKIGGAQAIAALTYGTETIPSVDKIVGPGNIYVAIAKKEVNGIVGIDMIAGPSEIVVIADQYSNPKFVAADLLAQAEHDTLAQSILITPSDDLINNVEKELLRQTAYLSRRSIIIKSLNDTGAIIKTRDIKEAIQISNKIAPEHLELQFNNAEAYINQVENAGAIFVGEYTPEPVGDYYAGPNHTLPTSGTARFSSALSTTDFIKKISLIKYSKTSLDKGRASIVRIAKEEGLTAHANAIEVRYDEV